MKSNAKQGVQATRQLGKLVCLGIVPRAAISAFVLALIPCSAFSAPEVSRQYIGNLGGAKFSFPADLVQNVEYDGDPGWGERRPKERPVRTFASGFRSMGLEFSYPDFSPVKLAAYAKEPTIDVTILANSGFGDGKFLDRILADMNRDPNFVYTESKEKFHGLRYFALKISPEYINKVPIGVSRARDSDIFIGEKNGKISSYIKCGNLRGQNSICSHSIWMHGYKSKFTMHYKREFLYNWLKIEENVIIKVKSFEIK